MTLLIFTSRAQPCTNKFHRLSIHKVFRQSVLSPYLSPKVIPRTILRALILTFCTSSRLEARIFIQKLFNYSAQHTRTGLFIIRANSMQHWLHTIRWLSYSRTSRSINIGEWVSVSGVWERSHCILCESNIPYRAVGCNTCTDKAALLALFPLRIEW